MNRINTLNLIWIDLEMTGLDPDSDRIIEVATVVTDPNLSVLDEGPSLVINQSNTLLDSMDEWNTVQHGRSGLTDRVRSSVLTEKEAMNQTLDFLKKWVPEGSSPMCGNSIGQDRRFLARCMPKLESFCHYRNIDVSSIRELGKRWYFEDIDNFQKNSNHRAIDDIRDSIEELRYYRKKIFRL